MSGILAGRRVLVVGAGTRPTTDPEAPPGNGRAIAVVAGRQGAAVACADLDADAAAHTADLVAETGASRITRYWLTGDRTGEVEVVLDDLPGYPDNLSIGSDGLVWCALAAPRNPVLEGIIRLPPRARKILAKVPERLGPSPEDVVWVIAFDFDGKIVHDIKPEGVDYTFVTSVAERDGVLYFGTIVDNALGVYQLA